METILHHYHFNLDTAEDSANYQALREKLNVTHAGKLHNVLADTRKTTGRKNSSEPVKLSEKHLFGNQWNEEGENGRRLFDWYEGIYPNRLVKNGHWLEITPAMEAIRNNTLTCGYCDKFVRPADLAMGPLPWHCTKCLGSEYLKASDVHLLRLLPVSHLRPVRPPLTDAEKAEIMPLYNTAQGLGVLEREKMAASKNRRDVAALIPKAKADGAALIRKAEIETAAYTWLLDHGVNMLDNIIYYDHTGRFGFGWRNAIPEKEKSALLDILCEFPFDYDIK